MRASANHAESPLDSETVLLSEQQKESHLRFLQSLETSVDAKHERCFVSRLIFMMLRIVVKDLQFIQVTCAKCRMANTCDIKQIMGSSIESFRSILASSINWPHLPWAFDISCRKKAGAGTTA